MDDTLTVPGLLLRPWTEQDIPALVAAHRDPVMRRWLVHPVTSDQDARRVVRTRLADREAGRGFSFAVLEVDPAGNAGPPVGSVSVRGLGGESVSGDVGYWVVSAARGRGIAPRALAAVCDWTFRLPRATPVERLDLIHAVGNHASCRVADKAQFAFTAVLPPQPPEFPTDGHLHVRHKVVPHAADQEGAPR